MVSGAVASAKVMTVAVFAVIAYTSLCHVPEVNTSCLPTSAPGIKFFEVSVSVVVDPAVAVPNISMIRYFVVASGVNPGVVSVRVLLVFPVIAIFPDPIPVPAIIRTLYPFH